VTDVVAGEPLNPWRRSWLELLAELFDPETIERLERIGVPEGGRALEVGAATGTIAARLAELVGPSGEVIAADIDTRVLEEWDDPPFRVLRHDLLTDDFEPGSFDLVHCRAVLLLLGPDQQAVIERMASWLRPGGVLLCEEPWIDVARLSPDPTTARAVAGLDRAAPHVDGAFARRLPAALAAAGLEEVTAEGSLQFFAGGSARAAFHLRALIGYTDALIEAGILEPDDRQRLEATYTDPATLECGWPRLAAWGRRAG
jgi:SAM-dependent methyltransferase